MKLKPGVRLTDLSPQMVLGAVIVRDAYQSLDTKCSCTVTSGNDSKHSDASKHFKGNALDFRTHDFAGDKDGLRQAVKSALGNDFDVVLEALGTPNEHLHVEYDPK